MECHPDPSIVARKHEPGCGGKPASETCVAVVLARLADTVVLIDCGIAHWNGSRSDWERYTVKIVTHARTTQPSTMQTVPPAAA
jgi:hypothetical protein